MDTGFPSGTVVKNTPSSAGDTIDSGSISGSEDTLEEEMPTHCSILAGDSHGQRRLEGYSPEGHKESDTTEHMHREKEMVDLSDFLLKTLTTLNILNQLIGYMNNSEHINIW